MFVAGRPYESSFFSEPLSDDRSSLDMLGLPRFGHEDTVGSICCKDSYGLFSVEVNLRRPPAL